MKNNALHLNHTVGIICMLDSINVRVSSSIGIIILELVRWNFIYLQS